jgi:hypothetical protein
MKVFCFDKMIERVIISCSHFHTMKYFICFSTFMFLEVFSFHLHERRRGGLERRAQSFRARQNTVKEKLRRLLRKKKKKKK